MKYLIFLLSLTLVGCSAINPTVTFKVNCQEMRGKVGNTCVINVPDSSNVRIDGDSIIVDYEGRSLQ